MDLKKLHGTVPWITKEGYFDPGKYPIDGALKRHSRTTIRSSDRG